jgi:hypothetical protein
VSSEIEKKTKTAACIHQPVYFPWLGFFHKLNLSDIYIVLDDCQAIKRSWMSRVPIKTNVDGAWLTVPVHFKNRSHQLVKDMMIDNESDWVSKHIKTVQRFYTKAPFFNDIFEIFQKVVLKRYKYLIDLNMDCIRRLLDYLKINVKMVFSSQIKHEESFATLRLINLVKAVNADIYVCGLGSKGYLESDLFQKHNLILYYQKYETFEYPQLRNGKFIPGLSIIDTLANIGPKGVAALLEKNNRLNKIAPNALQ